MNSSKVLTPLVTKTTAAHNATNFNTESFTIWYRCQLCPRAFGKCEDLIDHKFRDHLQHNPLQIQSQNYHRRRKKSQNRNPQPVNDDDSNDEQMGQVTESKIPITQPNLDNKNKSKIRSQEASRKAENDSSLAQLTSPLQINESTIAKVEMKVVTLEGGQKAFECRFCGQIISRRRNCIDHENGHLGLKNYKCRFCSRLFTWARNCTVHERSCLSRSSDAEKQTETIPGFEMKLFKKEIDIDDGENGIDDDFDDADQIKNSSTELSSFVAQDKLSPIKTVNENGYARFQCRYCQKLFQNKSHVIDHELVHLGQRPYKCTFCSKTFSWSNYYKIHEIKCSWNQAKREAELTIEEGSMSKPKSNLNFQHQQASKANPSSISQAIVSLKPLQKMISNQPETELGDDNNQKARAWASVKKTCKDLTLDPEAGKNAELQVKAEPIYEGKSKGRKLAATEEIRINWNEKREESLRFIKIQTNEKGDLNYECKICDKISSKKWIAVKHYMVHIGYRPFKCSYCDKGFSTALILDDHESMHTGIKKHACKFCGSLFHRRNDRNAHQRLRRCAGVGNIYSDVK